MATTEWGGQQGLTPSGEQTLGMGYQKERV